MNWTLWDWKSHWIQIIFHQRIGWECSQVACKWESSQAFFCMEASMAIKPFVHTHTIVDYKLILFYFIYIRDSIGQWKVVGLVLGFWVTHKGSLSHSWSQLLMIFFVTPKSLLPISQTHKIPRCLSLLVSRDVSNEKPTNILQFKNIILS